MVYFLLCLLPIIRSRDILIHCGYELSARTEIQDLCAGVRGHGHRRDGAGGAVRQAESLQAQRRHPAVLRRQPDAPALHDQGRQDHRLQRQLPLHRRRRDAARTHPAPGHEVALEGVVPDLRCRQAGVQHHRGQPVDQGRRRRALRGAGSWDVYGLSLQPQLPRLPARRHGGVGAEEAAELHRAVL
jgi:hypothetical protein